MKFSAAILPDISKETTDRNRTSPFAFTGNKFEFRMVGGSLSISGPNIVLNTIMAESLSVFADTLEKSTDTDLEKAVNDIVCETIAKHKRIIFNGNNYSEEWLAEAEKRGLANLKSTPEALPYFTSEKSVKLFTKHGVFSEKEIESRCEILLENYCTTLNIEAVTMVELAQREILPAALQYIKELSETASLKAAVASSAPNFAETDLIGKLSALSDNLYKKVADLQTALMNAKDYEDTEEMALYYRNTIFVSMNELRAIADEIEPLVGKKYWPFPTYGEMLFY
jgi:glutamine synthetase